MSEDDLVRRGDVVRYMGWNIADQYSIRLSSIPAATPQIPEPYERAMALVHEVATAGVGPFKDSIEAEARAIVAAAGPEVDPALAKVKELAAEHGVELTDAAAQSIAAYFGEREKAA